LSASSHPSNWMQPERRPRFLGLEVTGWALLLVGATLAVAVINISIVRPTQWQLDQVRRQMAQLETQMQELVGQRDEVAATNSLLSQLTEQSYRRAQADRALDEIAGLHTRLNLQTGHIERGLRALEKFSALQSALVENEDRVGQAAEVLLSLEKLEDRLTGRQYDTVQSHLAVDAIDSLRDRLIDVHCQATIAEDSLNAIDALHARLGETQAANPAALASLEALVSIRDRLDDQGTGIEVAQERIGQLIDLKDQAIAQTEDMATATANLELMVDIQEQFERIAGTFGRMRLWIAEVVAFEPTFNRAMRTLQPLVELGNLRHMNANELRQVVRSLSERRDAQLATPDGQPATVEAADAADPALDSTSEQSSDVPPVVESARAN
jgi:hypothetical protein